MSINETTAESYERPTITVVGTLREKTESALQNKYYAPTSDYHYPNSLSFNLS